MRKRRSDRVSDGFAARLSREIGARTPSEKRATGDPGALARMETTRQHGFMRCPHCREFVALRSTCRGCGAELQVE